ncbi:MAG TPA: DUF1553 domain-containing protein [Bryobacteraceae bacterium]
MAVRLVSAALILSGCITFTFAATPDSGTLNYDRDIRPILSENCFACHGQDSKKRMAGLRLDSFAEATKDRKGHTPIVPGHPEDSLMYQRITAEPAARRMPPPYSNRVLTADQIATLKKWIEQGGVYTPHWAFIPPKRPAVPEVADRAWVKQPIDAFVAQRLQAEGLHPNKPATPATWLRRVSLDLAGLPPSPDELDAFTRDAAARGEAAYTAVVDRLLASPRYGERMAIDWLDTARYADTHGFNNDSSRSMWRWRDWVIQSFNQNLPYNTFLTDQLAGDLLPNPTLDQRIATGFLRDGVINSEGGIIDEEYRVEYVADRVSTVSLGMMGLTMGCSRCHDHKYDPITQRDYYRMFAFFNNVPEIGEDGRVANAVPIMPAPTTEQQQKLQQLRTAIDDLSAKLAAREKKAKPADSLPQASVPDGAVLQIACDSATDFDPKTPVALTEGISGQACQMKDAPAKLQIPGKGVPIGKWQPVTFSLWVRRGAADQDVALLSSGDYGINPASVPYGKGMDIRLAGSEVEFRYSDRFPAYSIHVRSHGADLAPGQWHNLSVVYRGAIDPDARRAEAAAVRLLVDGRELPFRVLNDDLSLPEAKSEKASPVHFRVGWDTHPDSARFTGDLDQISAWSRALSTPEIESVFRAQALPYALRREQAHQATPLESTWLRTARLEAADPSFAADHRKLDALREEWLTLDKSVPTVMVMQEMPHPRETHILLRGQYDAPGDRVEAGVPEELLGTWPKDAPKNRLGLAQWITRPDHPLTARVAVNRMWQQLFGEGIVKSSDNFGMQGDWPSHPELLDWLACEFVDSGWNVKAMMKRIVLSSTYREDSDATPEMIARDPENRLLARGPRFRLPAEIVRDEILSLSGLLKNHLGGPSVFPYQPEGLYKGIVVAAPYPGTNYPLSHGDDLYRRSLYTFWKRTVPNPTMNVFDAPDREFCVVKRAVTNTPLQALALLNDPTFVEAARKLAERTIHEGGTPDARLAYAFRLATGRSPDTGERAVLHKKLDQMLAAYHSDQAGALGLVSVGASSRDQAIPVDELAAYTAIANMILNLDEVITKS